MAYIIAIVLAIIVGLLIGFNESDFFLGGMIGLLVCVILTVVAVATEETLQGSTKVTEAVGEETYTVDQVSIGTVNVTSTTYVHTGGGANGVGGVMVPITSTDSHEEVTYLNTESGEINKVNASKCKLFYNEKKGSTVTISKRRFIGLSKWLFGSDAFESEYIFKVGKD